MKLVNFWQLIGLILFLILVGLSIGNCCFRCKDADKVKYPPDFEDDNKRNDDKDTKKDFKKDGKSDNSSDTRSYKTSDTKSDKSSDTKSDKSSDTKSDNSSDSSEEGEDDDNDDKGNKKKDNKNNNKRYIYLVNEPLEQIEMVLKKHEYKPKKKKKNDPEIFGLRKFPKKADDGDSSGGRPLDLISIENEEEKPPIKGDKKTHIQLIMIQLK